MKKSLLLALLSTGVMFGSIGHSSSHSSSHSMSHSSAHVSSHISGHSSLSHSSGFHSNVHPTMHSNTGYDAHTSPYHPTGNIRTSSVEYHPLHKYYYYPIMNHNTKTMDTIKGKTADEVQSKVNGYVKKNDINWVGLGSLVAIVGCLIGFIAWSNREKKDA